MLELISSLLKLIEPRAEFQNIKLSKKQFRFEKQKLRVAEKTFKRIEKEFEKDGLDYEERQILKELSEAILKRKTQLINF